MFYLPLGSGGAGIQLGRWEDEFPQQARTSPARRLGSFDVGSGSAISLEVAGGWSGGGPAKKPGDDDVPPLTDGYAMRAAIMPGVAAKEGEKQMAYFIKATGPRGVIERGSPAIAAFVESLQRG